MKHKNIKLSTSNKNKIKEFKSFGLDFEVVLGADLKEVKSNFYDVIIHKAIDAGEGFLVEDTVLVINDEEVVDIRWKIPELVKYHNPKINWITLLAILDNGVIYIYRGEIECALVQNADVIKIPNDAFGFDPYLVPAAGGIKTALTFYELDQLDMKSDFSPRKFAVDALLLGIYINAIDASSIPVWNGEYQ